MLTAGALGLGAGVVEVVVVLVECPPQPSDQTRTDKNRARTPNLTGIIVKYGCGLNQTVQRKSRAACPFVIEERQNRERQRPAQFVALRRTPKHIVFAFVLPIPADQREQNDAKQQKADTRSFAGVATLHGSG